MTCSWDKETKMKYLDSIINLDHWLEEHEFKGYEPRDVLASKLNLMDIMAFRRLNSLKTREMKNTNCWK